MAEYLVKVADERGHVQENVHLANSAEELRQRFAQSGQYVYWVKPKGLTGRSGKRVKLEPFLIFNQQFLTLLKAGLPILSSVELLAKRQKSMVFRAQLEDVAVRVRTGQSLSEAFESQGGFPVIYTTSLLAGERSGNLEEVLSRYLAFQRVALTFRKKLVASLVYPVLLIVMVTGLFLFLISFVVPRFASLYDQIGTKLPAITVFMLQLGKNFQAYLPYLLIGAVLIGLGVFRWARSDRGADSIDRVRIATPIFGGIWVKYQVGLFARTLSTLLAGGLPLVPSLETAAKSIGSSQLSKAVLQSVTGVREGKGLATSLNSTKIFPELSIEMIEVGEATGALPGMLNSVAEFFEEDVQTALTAALSLIEPAILIVMGGVVVTILIALYLPIFSLGAASSMQH